MAFFTTISTTYIIALSSDLNTFIWLRLINAFSPELFWPTALWLWNWWLYMVYITVNGPVTGSRHWMNTRGI
jgi:hypothetical protein